MKTGFKILIVLLLAGAVAGTVALKDRQSSARAGAEMDEGKSVSSNVANTEEASVSASLTVATSSETAQEPLDSSPAQGIPKLVDLGADKCIPCKAMAPILEELKKEYAGVFEVQFIDVWKNPGAGQEYGIRVIPTQIFYSADGEEILRHEGFFSKEDILAVWKESGVL